MMNSLEIGNVYLAFTTLNAFILLAHLFTCVHILMLSDMSVYQYDTETA